MINPDLLAEALVAGAVHGNDYRTLEGLCTALLRDGKIIDNDRPYFEAINRQLRMHRMHLTIARNSKGRAFARILRIS